MLAAGVQKLGARIENAFAEAVRSGVARRQFVERGDFLWKIGMEAPPVRDRSNLPNGSRKLEFVASEEIERAIVEAVALSYGMKPDEVPTAVCKIFGFARVTDDMKSEVEPHVRALVKAGQLRLNGQNLTSQADSA
jgi:hypothetical protein